MLRSIVAVVVGFLLWTVLWLGSNSILTIVTPDSFNEDGSTDRVGIFILLLILSALFSVIAGYTTAWIARINGMRSALILGIILLLVGIFVQIQFWDLFPIWYNLIFLVLLLPATLLGAKLRI